MASMQAIKDGRCDAGAIFANALWGVKEADGLSPGDFQVIGTTTAIPLDATVARPDLPEATRAAVQNALVSMKRDSPAAEGLRKAFNRVDGFEAAKDSDYDGIREVLRREGQLGNGGTTPADQPGREKQLSDRVMDLDTKLHTALMQSYKVELEKKCSARALAIKPKTLHTNKAGFVERVSVDRPIGSNEQRLVDCIREVAVGKWRFDVGYGNQILF